MVVYWQFNVLRWLGITSIKIVYLDDNLQFEAWRQFCRHRNSFCRLRNCIESKKNYVSNILLEKFLLKTQNAAALKLANVTATQNHVYFRSL